jgi:peptidoglycan hydrolase-like protein with peptidoglycan-binding domain
MLRRKLRRTLHQQQQILIGDIRMQNEISGLQKTIRRQRLMLWVVAAALLLSVSGLVASLFIKSPAQRLLETEPPPPSVVTAVVENRHLVRSVMTRGTVEAKQLTTVGIPPLIEHPIVTRSKAVGDVVNIGDVVAEVSGRPIIALPGEFPAYRDINPGNSGTDVGQLQQGLAAAGLYSGPVDGVFGPETQSGVAALFRRAGFEPATTADDNPGEEDSLIAARQSVTAARRSLEDARSAEPQDTRSVARAREDLTTAEDALNRIVARQGVRVRLGEIAFVPVLPATVAANADPRVGTDVGATPIISIQTGEVVISATIQPGQEVGVSAGLGATFNDEVRRREGAGQVVSIGDFQLGDDYAGSEQQRGYPVVVQPDPALDSDWLGTSVALRIVVEESDGDVLAVPSTAVSSRESGRYVTTLDSAGARTEVQVTTGLIADGFVEVASVNPGELVEGVKVVVS